MPLFKLPVCVDFSTIKHGHILFLNEKVKVFSTFMK